MYLSRALKTVNIQDVTYQAGDMLLITEEEYISLVQIKACSAGAYALPLPAPVASHTDS